MNLIRSSLQISGTNPLGYYSIIGSGNDGERVLRS